MTFLMSDLTALVLCGGKGSRLAPWPAPKCLLPVGGRPMLHRIVDHLAAGGVGKIVICVGYRAEDVIASMAGWSVYFSNAGEGATMVRRLWEAWREHTAGGRILACYGDELSDVNIELLVGAHYNRKRPPQMTLTTYEQRLPFGVVQNGGQVDHDYQVAVNIGYAMIEAAVWDVPDIHSADGIAGMYNTLFKNDCGSVGEYRHIGKRATVNSFPELENAEAVFAVGREPV